MSAGDSGVLDLAPSAGPAPSPRRCRTARRPGRAAVGAPGDLHRAGRVRPRAVGDADAPRAGLAADRAVGTGGGARRGRALIAPPHAAGGGRGVGGGHPPRLPGLGPALALAQAHEHRAHRRPDRRTGSTSCPTRSSPTWAPTATCAWSSSWGRRSSSSTPPPCWRSPAEVGAWATGAALPPRCRSSRWPSCPRRSSGPSCPTCRACCCSACWRRSCGASGSAPGRPRRRSASSRSPGWAGAIAAPRIDQRSPWVDYRAWTGDGRARPRGHVQLEPDLRPAALAADRPRGVHGHREPGRGRLLEGRGPRHLQRLQLGRRAPAATDAAAAERGRSRPLDQDASRLDRRHHDRPMSSPPAMPASRDEPPGGHRAGRRRRDLAVGGADGPGDQLRGLGLLAAPVAP